LSEFHIWCSILSIHVGEDRFLSSMSAFWLPSFFCEYCWAVFLLERILVFYCLQVEPASPCYLHWGNVTPSYNCWSPKNTGRVSAGIPKGEFSGQFISAGIYTYYCISSELFVADRWWWSLPFVYLGLFFYQRRLLVLGDSRSPVDMLLGSPLMQSLILLWAATVLFGIGLV